MALKLKLNTGKAGSPDTAPHPPTPGSATPGSSTSLKLKVTSSQPPTPFSEHPASAAPAATAGGATKKGGGGRGGSKTASGSGSANRKRPANDDTISPAAKRPAKPPGPTRKFSLKPPPAPALARVAATEGGDVLPSLSAGAGSGGGGGAAAGGGNKLLLRRRSTQPRLHSLNVKRPPPPRIPGHGYDSEDSEAEEDPAVQQAFILRMEPGEDCEYLRNAIANGTVGLPASEGPAEVSMKFVEKDNRRAVVTVRGKMYAAALVDMPCVVETMKSWDKKGWWKVADISQMLLVLGRCSSEAEAKTFELPKEVDKNTFQYAHGLTPPMRWVRKRRFRKRLSYKTIANVEEEVERLLREDQIIESQGGTVHTDMLERGELERSQEPDPSQIDDDEEGDAIETVEHGQGYDEYYDDAVDDEMADADLEGNLQAMFDEDHANASATPTAAEVTQSPAPLADQAASFAAVENAMAVADSPAAGETPADDGSPSSDEDEDDVSDEDEDSPDVMDEDAAAEAAERNQQLEEVADLEREVEAQRKKVESQRNQILKDRAMTQLRTLEEDLRVKKSVLGMGDDGMEEGE